MTKINSEPQAIRYDAHCHIISREVFFNRILIMFIDASKGYKFKKLVRKAPADETEKEKSDRIRILKLLELLLDNRTGAETFNDLRGAYAEMDSSVQKYIPLMVDFEYIFKTKYDVSTETDKDKKKQEKQHAKVLEKFDKLKSKINEALEKKLAEVDKDLLGLLTRVIKETDSKKRAEKGLDKLPEEIIKPYQRQLETFTELKHQFGSDFVPFLAVDPRRPDMMELIKTYVGKDKPFYGIKLYPPMGYSPTDPFLYGTADNNDCLYQYCIDNQLPIITHCSSGGFCTFVKRLEVIGDVMPDMEFSSQPVHYSQITEIKFDTNILKFGEAVEERAYKLNHPKLWEIVLKKFPSLKIDLAHFGGDPNEYGNERREYIFQLMQETDNGTPKYPNLYTDLSCITQKELLQDIHDNKYSQLPDRFMYGSDYFLNLIWGEDFKEYYQNFTEVFGREMDRIGVGNVEGFLLLAEKGKSKV